MWISLARVPRAHPPVNGGIPSGVQSIFATSLAKVTKHFGIDPLTTACNCCRGADFRQARRSDTLQNVSRATRGCVQFLPPQFFNPRVSIRTLVWAEKKMRFFEIFEDVPEGWRNLDQQPRAGLGLNPLLPHNFSAWVPLRNLTDLSGVFVLM